MLDNHANNSVHQLKTRPVLSEPCQKGKSQEKRLLFPQGTTTFNLLNTLQIFTCIRLNTHWVRDGGDVMSIVRTWIGCSLGQSQS